MGDTALVQSLHTSLHPCARVRMLEMTTAQLTPVSRLTTKSRFTIRSSMWVNLVYDLSPLPSSFSGVDDVWAQKRGAHLFHVSMEFANVRTSVPGEKHYTLIIIIGDKICPIVIYIRKLGWRRTLYIYEESLICGIKVRIQQFQLRWPGISTFNVGSELVLSLATWI